MKTSIDYSLKASPTRKNCIILNKKYTQYEKNDSRIYLPYFINLASSM